MIYLGDQDTIEGVVVYGDDKEFHKFYLIPEQPRFRLDERGRPIFKFLKYRYPVDRPDGKKGGGFVSFDVEFSVAEGKMDLIREVLQKRVNTKAQELNVFPIPSVQIGFVNYTEGTCHLNIQDEEDGLIEKVFDAGKPSLYGKNIANFFIELSQFGAEVFEKALQGQGGFIGVVYDLYFDMKLPPVKVEASFNASAFYSFVQDIEIDDRDCDEDDYRETVNEVMNQSEARHIMVDPGSSQVEREVLDSIRTWVQKSLDEAATRMMIESLPVEDPADARKWYQENSKEDIRKVVTRNRISNFKLSYSEEAVVSNNIVPQGVLPNITGLTDYDGNPIVWEDYAQVIDLDDDFFKQVRVAARINADFDNLPLHSVELKLRYAGDPMNVLNSDIEGEYIFQNAEDVAEFASYIVENEGEYEYSYRVNYLGAAKSFESQTFRVDIAEGQLTVNVDDMGLLQVQVAPGDLNFNQVDQVHLTLQYEDQDNGVDLFEQQFILDPDNLYHQFEEIIFAKREKSYKYKCKYFMKDGKEYQVDLKKGNSNTLYINDPFSGTKKIGIRAAGDLDLEIKQIFVDFVYEEKDNGYKQSASITLNRDTPFSDWTFPVVDESLGEVSYSGSIEYMDDTVEEIKSTPTDKSTPLVGEKIKDVMTIKVLAYLAGLDKDVDMIHVKLEHMKENGEKKQKEMTFTSGVTKKMEESWKVKLADKDATKYSWTATYYYLTDTGLTTKVVGPNPGTDLTLILVEPQ